MQGHLGLVELHFPPLGLCGVFLSRPVEARRPWGKVKSHRGNAERRYLPCRGPFISGAQEEHRGKATRAGAWQDVGTS